MTPSKRLWSLLDMLKFHADKFVALTSVLRSLTMYFLNPNVQLTKDDRGMIAVELAKALELIEEIGLTHSAKKAKKISEQTTFDGYNAKHFAIAIDELQERIKDELEDGYFLYLSEEEVKFFAPKEPLFGGEIETAFPSILYEVDEAAKCLALGRSTASVFHLMRVLEIGIGAIRQSLSIPDPIKPSDRNWGNILKKIKDGIDHKSPPWKAGDKALFEEAYASLDAVRAAWRNSTMHIENKYNPEEAEHIYVVVKGFMKKIASRMDEHEGVRSFV